MTPVLFIGHGHPLNAIQRNAFTATLARAGEALPRPAAILVISAHWLSRGGVAVSAADRPETIHDFGNFHPDLFRVGYPAPGAPREAGRAAELISPPAARVDLRRGLDHGAWTVLRHLFPAADIPVFQLSIEIAQPPRFHYELARRLLPASALRARPPAGRRIRAIPVRGVPIRQRQHALPPHRMRRVMARRAAQFSHATPSMRKCLSVAIPIAAGCRSHMNKASPSS